MLGNCISKVRYGIMSLCYLLLHTHTYTHTHTHTYSLREDTGEPALDLIYFSQWCFGVSSLLLYAVTITHLFCGNPITIFLVSCNLFDLCSTKFNSACASCRFVHWSHIPWLLAHRSCCCRPSSLQLAGPFSMTMASWLGSTGSGGRRKHCIPQWPMSLWSLRVLGLPFSSTWEHALEQGFFLVFQWHTIGIVCDDCNNWWNVVSDC